MESLFLLFYNFFRNKRVLFFALVILVGLIAVFLASRIRFEEDITRMISGVEHQAEVTKIIEQSGFLDKIIVSVSLADTTLPPDPDNLIRQAEMLADTLKSEAFQPYIKAITFRISGSAMEEVFDIVYRNLPIFLEEKDYRTFDTLLTNEVLERNLYANYRTLLSPASFAMKRMIVRDPAGLSAVALKKLNAFQQDDNYRVIENCIFSKDKKHLLLFLTTAYPSGATSQNTVFVKMLDRVIASITAAAGNELHMEYFGSAVVAVGNAERLKKDIRLTMSITIILLLLIISFSIKKKRLFPFIFLPAIFGGVMALAVIYLIQAKISIISLSIGTVILAITVDYALHITTHYKHTHSVAITIKDVSFPIIVCGFATAFEFISLVFVSSESLNELGILAAISVITASFFTMVVMPHILDLTKGKLEKTEEKNYLERILDKITRYNFDKNVLLNIFMVIFTVVCWVFVHKVGFETDMMRMNYISSKLAKTEENLNRINNYKLNSVYVIAHGGNLQEALLHNDKLMETGKELMQGGRIHSFNSPGMLLFSDSMQLQRINRWNAYWTESRKRDFLERFDRIAEQTGFNVHSFGGFHDLVNRSYAVLDTHDFRRLQAHFFNENIITTPQFATVVSVVKADDLNKEFVTGKISEIPGIVVMDRKSILSGMVETLGKDFSFIANVSLSLILVILIIAFGRFELGFITFIPIFLSWVWTLGIMGMAGIKFNIFNIIISSFITGLGIDYSIYIMQGLVQGYKSDNKSLLSYKTCILISVMISISGTGVLILAKHPALNSIALISIIGLTSVVLISYTFEPILFTWLVSKKGKGRDMPITLTDFLITLWVIVFFIPEFLFMLLLRLLVIPLPIRREKKKRFMHIAFSWSLRVLSYVAFFIRKRTINESHEDFKKPAIIVCNHKSNFDVPFIIRMSPNIIVLTARWVWNNPVFAPTIRYLDFYPLNDGYEAILDKLKKKVQEGYSIMVFPEGTRSPDSSIGRFHKGAFLLAEKLNLDILPILIHGTKEIMNKGENHVKAGRVTVKILPRIGAGDTHFGIDYHERTKAFQRFIREEYRRMQGELETPAYFRKKLIRNYIYKGPVLEWYTRIKLSLEHNYGWFHERIPRDASIVDIGCGYGMMAYMLNLTSDRRHILGIDYDNDKIELANNCLSKNGRIRFVAADAVTYDYPAADVYIMSDVLHYMPEEEQEKLLIRCMERLKSGGQIIIRDADKDLRKRHAGTRSTEFFSTRLGFNKTIQKKLYFFAGRKITEIAKKHAMDVEIIDSTRLTSNLLYVLKHKPQEADIHAIKEAGPLS